MNIGDKVVWYRQSKRGKVISFEKNIGMIKAINGDAATIETIAGGHVRKPIVDLTLKADDTPLAIFGYAAGRLTP